LTTDRQHQRFRVLRPLQIGGRIAGVHEVVRLDPSMAVEWVESGHLRLLDTAVPGITEGRAD